MYRVLMVIFCLVCFSCKNDRCYNLEKKRVKNIVFPILPNWKNIETADSSTIFHYRYYPDDKQVYSIKNISLIKQEKNFDNKVYIVSYFQHFAIKLKKDIPYQIVRLKNISQDEDFFFLNIKLDSLESRSFFFDYDKELYELNMAYFNLNKEKFSIKEFQDFMKVLKCLEIDGKDLGEITSDVLVDTITYNELLNY